MLNQKNIFPLVLLKLILCRFLKVDFKSFEDLSSLLNEIFAIKTNRIQKLVLGYSILNTISTLRA